MPAAALYAALMAAHECQNQALRTHDFPGPEADPRPVGTWRTPAHGTCAPDAATFDAHVFACAISLAAAEADRGDGALTGRLGIGQAALEAVFARYFSPRAFLHLPVPVGDISSGAEEEGLVSDLLRRHAIAPFTGPTMAALIARRAMEPNHLWQDLGLRNRGELSHLLEAHFPELAAGNTAHMKWKKYFYRRLCEAEGFVLCSAPSCRVCTDFDTCFGDESGESRLAHRRRAQETAHAAPPPGPVLSGSTTLCGPPEASS